MNLIEKTKEKYIGQNIKSQGFFFELSLFLTKEFLNQNIHINKINYKNNTVYISILDNGKSINLLEIKLILKDKNIKDLNFNINNNYLLLKNNNKLNNLLQ